MVWGVYKGPVVFRSEGEVLSRRLLGTIPGLRVVEGSLRPVPPPRGSVSPSPSRSPCDPHLG